MALELLTEYLTEVLLSRAGFGTVVVGKVEMAYTAVECLEEHLPGNREIVHTAEIVPQAERKYRELYAAGTAISVYHNGDVLSEEGERKRRRYSLSKLGVKTSLPMVASSSSRDQKRPPEVSALG